MFSLGFSTLGCPDYSVDQVIDLARGSGFDGVEIRLIRGQVELAQLLEFSDEQIADTRGRFDRAGVDVVCIDTSIRFSETDADAQRAQVELARHNSRIAEGLGAPFLRVFGGALPAGPRSSADRRRHLAGVARGLNLVAGVAAESGITVLLETHDDFCTSAAVDELWSEGVRDDVGLLWDTLHTYRFGESPEATWARIGDRVRHVHVKDAHAATPDHVDFALTGEGVVPIPEIVATLVDGGFNGYVDFEWEKAWHPEIEPPEVAIPHFARYMAQLTASIPSTGARQ